MDEEEADDVGVVVPEPVAEKMEEEAWYDAATSSSIKQPADDSSAVSLQRSSVRDPGKYSYGLIYVFWSLSFYEQQYFLKKSVQRDLDEGRRLRKDISRDSDMIKRLSKTKRFVWEPQINNPERTIIEINKEIAQLTTNTEVTDRTIEILMRFMAGKELMFHRFAAGDVSQMRVLPEPTTVRVA